MQSRLACEQLAARRITELSKQTYLMVKSNVGVLRNIQQKNRSPLVSIVSGSLLVDIDSVRGFHLCLSMLQATDALGMTVYWVVCPNDCSTKQEELCNPLADQDSVPVKHRGAPQIKDMVNQLADCTSIHAAAPASPPGLTTSVDACLLQ